MFAKRKKALIVGCGYVGLSLAKLLQGENWIVHGIKRSSSPGKKIRHLKIDVAKPFSLTESYDVVFYMVSAGSFSEDAYESAYSLGVTNTLQALLQHKQKSLFIFVSSTSLYAQNNGEWVTEQSAISLEGFARKTLFAGEELVRNSDLPFSIVRFGGIYGSGRDHLITQIKEGKAFLKDKSHFTNRIHQEDCAKLLGHIANLAHRKELYIGVDNDPADYNEVLRYITSILGADETKLRIEAGSGSRHRANKRCSNALIQSSGYEFIYPSYREGYASLIGPILQS